MVPLYRHHKLETRDGVGEICLLQLLALETTFICTLRLTFLYSIPAFYSHTHPHQEVSHFFILFSDLTIQNSSSNKVRHLLSSDCPGPCVRPHFISKAKVLISVPSLLSSEATCLYSVTSDKNFLSSYILKLISPVLLSEEYCNDYSFFKVISQNVAKFSAKFDESRLTTSQSFYKLHETCILHLQ